MQNRCSISLHIYKMLLSCFCTEEITILSVLSVPSSHQYSSGPPISYLFSSTCSSVAQQGIVKHSLEEGLCFTIRTVFHYKKLAKKKKCSITSDLLYQLSFTNVFITAQSSFLYLFHSSLMVITVWLYLLSYNLLHSSSTILGYTNYSYWLPIFPWSPNSGGNARQTVHLYVKLVNFNWNLPKCVIV